MFDPANPHFEATLPRFVRFLLIREDRFENALKADFESQKGPKIHKTNQNTQKNNLKTIKKGLKNNIEKTHDFQQAFFTKMTSKREPKRAPKSIKTSDTGGGNLIFSLLGVFGYFFLNVGGSGASWGAFLALFSSIFAPLTLFSMPS